jgi:hypothetical protein
MPVSATRVVELSIDEGGKGVRFAVMDLSMPGPWRGKRKNARCRLQQHQENHWQFPSAHLLVLVGFAELFASLVDLQCWMARC